MKEYQHHYGAFSIYLIGILSAFYLIIHLSKFPTWTPTSLSQYIHHSVREAINDEKRLNPSEYKPIHISQKTLKELSKLPIDFKLKLIELYQIMFSQYDYELEITSLELQNKSNNQIAHQFIYQGKKLTNSNDPLFQHALFYYQKTAKAVGLHWEPSSPEFVSLYAIP